MLGYVCKIKVRTIIILTLLIGSIFVLKFGTNNEDEIPILLWWTPFAAVDQTIECQSSYKCLITSNRKLQNSKRLRAFLFYGSHFKPYDIPTTPRTKTPWAIVHEESPKNVQIFLHKEGQELFNITSTFSRHSDFPLTFQYLKTLDYLMDKRFYVDTKEKNEFLRDISPVLYMSSNCDTPSYRDSYVRELMKYIKVDSYGKCLHNKQLPKHLANDYLNQLYGDELLAFVARYKFTIAIENAICDDYITEKLWRPLIAGSVPIYLGSPSVADWLPNNSAVLMNNFKSIEQLAKYIHELNENDGLYETYLRHKLNSKDFVNANLSDVFASGYYGIKNNNEHPISAFQCFVCNAVHEQRVFIRSADKLVYDCSKPQSPFGDDDSWDTFWRYGKCELKAFRYFSNGTTEDIFMEKSRDLLRRNDCD